MHVMTRESAEKHGLYTICPITGQKIPFSSFRIELSEDEKKEHQKLLDEKALPF